MLLGGMQFGDSCANAAVGVLVEVLFGQLC